MQLGDFEISENDIENKDAVEQILNIDELIENSDYSNDGINKATVKLNKLIDSAQSKNKDVVSFIQKFA